MLSAAASPGTPPEPSHWQSVCSPVRKRIAVNNIIEVRIAPHRLIDGRLHLALQLIGLALISEGNCLLRLLIAPVSFCVISLTECSTTESAAA